MIKKGSWVEIRDIVLLAEQRADKIPEDTKKTPLLMWVKGRLLQDGNFGDRVEIETIIGRRLKGILERENPSYNHSFGQYIEEISFIGNQARSIIFKEGEENE